MYSRLMLFVSALVLAGALLLLPSGTALRVRRLAHAVVAPAEEMAALGARVSREALGGFPQGMTMEERDQLLRNATAANAALQGALAAREQLETDNLALHSLLRHVRQNRDYSLVVAEVLRPPLWRSAVAEVQIDRGAADGLREGQGVLTPEGFVGVVAEVAARSSWVRLLDSSNFSLCAEVGARQASGILENREEGLVMVSPMGVGYTSIMPGDQLLTSDMSGPEMQPGLLIGSVSEVKRMPDGTLAYRVTPAAGDLSAEKSPRFLLVAIPAAR